MNEINFNIEETEKIDLSMDVGVKEIFPPIENLEVTPTKEQQVFTHENSYGYDKVTVEPINLQDKSITIKSNGTQEIVSDEGYDGLNQVKVITQIDGGGSGMSNYSTEETLIGTWLGKPLYRKVVVLDMEPTTNSEFTKDVLGISDIEMIRINIGSSVAIYYAGSTSTSYGFSTISYYVSSTDRSHAYVNAKKSLVIQNQNVNPRKYHIVLEYTKTTD